MSRLYKKALIVGATSGIGEAMAVRLLEQGTSVVVVGRRQDRLDAFVKKHTKNAADGATVDAAPFDISNLDGIAAFTQKMTSSHKDLDCIVMNAGIQRGYDFTKPETIKLQEISQEVTTNYLSYIYMTVAFLPHLQSLKAPAHLVYMSSGLALNPVLIRSPNYCATKGALHNFLLGFREQLKQASDNQVQVVEVFPPAVQTELHSSHNQPDLMGGEDLGMPLAEFTDKMFQGLEKGRDQIPVGHEEPWAEDGFETKRQAAFHHMIPHILTMLKKFSKN